MEITYTKSQRNRLTELGCGVEETTFSSIEERELSYKKIEREMVVQNKNKLNNLFENEHRPKLCQLQETIAKALCDKGFTQVTTPTIITAKALEKMTVDENNKLYKQVFWLDKKSCLRPMLAPNLYQVSSQLLNNKKLPLRLFEIGSCFRKESEGNSHLKEFTMLNLVEWGTPIEERVQRLKELAEYILEITGITEYNLEEENSVVYGDGLDVVSSTGLELASTSMGPHALDDAWKINCSWVGLGFGLERLLMYREKEKGIHRHSKSLTFLDGACIRIK